MRDATLGVYLHVPFCERICPYCDFAVVRAPRLGAEAERSYVEAVLAELASRRDAFSGRALASLYLGGGTPSLLQPGSVARLLRAVGEAFPGTGPVEVTLEANPSQLEAERLAGFRAAGVTRLSLGVQSFDDRVLARLGRAHRADEARRMLGACRAAGFDALSVDLIFAAPGQTLAGFERDLDEAIAFAPDHLSTYELTIEEGTPFARARARGGLRLPDEDTALRMIERAEARLAAAGFERYEISSYARPGFAAVHNRRYWERRPVLGLGVGAFSNDPPGPEMPFGARRCNVRDLSTYLARLRAGASPEARPAEVFDARTARGEAVFLALRAARGLAAAAFADEFGGPPRTFFAPAIDALVAEGLLREGASGDLCLTARGRLLSDSVFLQFVG